jgi:hypothetical protein
MIGAEADRLFDPAALACRPLPSGRMSLLDMINFSLHRFVWALRVLSQELRIAVERSLAIPDALLDEEDDKRLRGNFGLVTKVCTELVLERACSRIERINHALRDRLTYTQIASELGTLMEAIHDDIQHEHFYHYPRGKLQPLYFVQREWTATLAAFPSLQKEIEEGLDCYGLDHHTACVFHMMRVAEIGLRSLARERGVSFPKHPLEWADWQNILEQTESKARAATSGMPRGPAKDAALAFYSGALGQLHAFKDTFRNVVMHVRRDYDELDGQRAINQVRDFMDSLSAKIGEKTRRPIRRWP